MPDASGLPTGTVTFLFTDIEGSTGLARELGPQWRGVIEEHNRLMREAIRGAGGIDVRTEGDAVFAAFESAPAAVSAAVAAQRHLAAAPWPEPIRVRMGLHTGEGVLGGDDYVGLDVHRAARTAAAGHGGQVLLSRATRSLVEGSLPAGVSLRALGRHRLKDLPEPEELHQLVIADLPSDFAPPRTLEVPTNIPKPLTTFVGRDKELDLVKLLLRENRLLTLTGPGGTGKTRLAIEAATGLLPSYSDGVFFVDLAAITDPVLVSSTIAVALGVPEQPGRTIQDSLKDAVRDRELLLVLDNFEQVLDAGPLIIELLEVSPRLTVLVTSRAALHLSGEQELPVPSMTMPDLGQLPPTERLPEFEAVRLFAERAASVDPSFAITDENATAVVEICGRLDGLPLAIELAASRIKVLSPSAILERLDHRMALLVRGAQDLPARQRTLREAIGWSYDLLDRDEQILFARLAAFVGGWTIDAAEAVAGKSDESGPDTLDVLGSLVDKSLVRKETEGGDRFAMLETIREFGLEMLEREGEADETRRRHAAYFLAMAEAAEQELTLNDPGWLDRLEREHDNLRAALRWSIETGEGETGLRIAGAVWRFWQMRGHLAEGQRLTDQLLALPAATPRTVARAKGLSAAGSLAWWLGWDSVRAPYEESMAIYRELGDERGQAEGAFNLGYANLMSGDMEGAKQLFLQSAAMFKDLALSVRLAHANTALALVAFREEDFQAANALTEEAHDTFVKKGDLWGMAMTSGVLGSIALEQGDLERCRAVALDSLDANERLGSSLGIAVSLQALAILATRLGRPEAGVRLAGAVDGIRKRAGGEAPRAIVGLENPLDTAKGALDEKQAAALWEDGRAMSLEEAVAFGRREAQRMFDESMPVERKGTQGRPGV